MIWKSRGRRLDLSQARLMGIVNLTPDSFSDGGRFRTPEEAAEEALRMIAEGADLIDLGAESSRQGADEVSEEEEWKRLSPVLKLLRDKTDKWISIDTEKAGVARRCLDAGADIINDVSALKTAGRAMADAVKTCGAGVILMHRRGNPRTMQSETHYRDLIEDILTELKSSLREALDCGIEKEQIVIDPGIGFAKDRNQNWEILRGLERFHSLGVPVLLGHSRKSFLSEVSNADPSQRDSATAALSLYAVLKGVQLLRVHAIRPNLEAVRAAEKIRKEESYVRTFKMGND